MKFSLENITNIRQLIRHLSAGLEKLNLLDNFETFQVDSLSISAGSEVKVRNQLKSIPSGYIIRFQQGNGLVTAGDTKWSKDFIYMKNHGASPVTLKILFTR
jgi:hypothetical protein